MSKKLETVTNSATIPTGHTRRDTGHDLLHDTHHTRRAPRFSVNRKINATEEEGHTCGTDKQTNLRRVVKPPPSRQTRRARVPIRRATSVGCPFCKRVSARFVPSSAPIVQSHDRFCPLEGPLALHEERLTTLTMQYFRVSRVAGDCNVVEVTRRSEYPAWTKLRDVPMDRCLRCVSHIFRKLSCTLRTTVGF